MNGQDWLYFNGINAESGDYALPPMSGAELAGFIRGLSAPENLAELRYRHRKATGKPLGVREGVDALKLDEAGWGIVFYRDADPALKAALQALIDLRREQAGAHFHIYEGYDGYHPDETKSEFLARHGAGPGPVDPAKVPYYLLLVGSPREIPYTFQTQLDVQYAVGRICFDTPQDYAAYARSVVASERGEERPPRRAVFFGVENPGDPATELSSRALVQPLLAELADARPDWQMVAALRDDATKRRLTSLLDGGEAAALLFTAGHGMQFPNGAARQPEHQGALLCQDWPGPQAWANQEPIPPDFYYSAGDLSPDSGPAGLVAFFFACYGAGTPQQDAFSRRAGGPGEEIAPYPFAAQLPLKMLSHPRGGALAVIGHVERAWGYSFFWREAGSQTAVFSSAIQRLLNGAPVGYAMEYFNQRYAELATELSDTLEEISFGKIVDPNDLAGLWTASNDARGYSVLGDPAVRCAVA